MNRHNKRAVKDEPIFLDKKLYKDLVSLISKIEWPYKTNKKVFWTRDKAFFAFLILTGCRVSEAINVNVKQFRSYTKNIILVNIQSMKHGLLRRKIILPKIGALSPVTYIFEDWLDMVEGMNIKDGYLFPRGNSHGLDFTQHFNRHRAYQIVSLTGKFPHWARSVCATIYGRKIFDNDAWKLKSFMGWKSLESSSDYISGSWEKDEKNLYAL